jgi:hypothetical protein
MNPFENAPIKGEGQTVDYGVSTFTLPSLGRLDQRRALIHVEIPLAWVDELHTWLGNKDTAQRHGKD